MASATGCKSSDTLKLTNDELEVEASSLSGEGTRIWDASRDYAAKARDMMKPSDADVQAGGGRRKFAPGSSFKSKARIHGRCRFLPLRESGGNRSRSMELRQ
jgi:hypothetical protein